jgi:hypothetical protein
MEPYAHALAELDAQRITRGGLFLDSAHSGETRRFARVYRELPLAPFETLCGATDPVAIRTCVRGTRRWLYLVNRDYYPVSVILTLRGPTTFVELGAGVALTAPPRWELALGPYELRAFAGPADAAVDAVSVAAPADVIAALYAEAADALAAIDAAAARGRHVPGADRMRIEIAEAVAGRRLAWLRRALSSYVVRKCHELAQAPG